MFLREFEKKFKNRQTFLYFRGFGLGDALDLGKLAPRSKRYGLYGVEPRSFELLHIALVDSTACAFRQGFNEQRAKALLLHRGARLLVLLLLLLFLLHVDFVQAEIFL